MVPLAASITVKYFASFAEMSATAFAGVGDWYLSLLTKRFRRERSTHMRILSDPFWGLLQ